MNNPTPLPLYSSTPTICAVSTPYGIGGIAVIRVSGPEAIAIVDTLFTGKRPLKEAKANTIHYGKLANIDEVWSPSSALHIRSRGRM